MQTLAGGVGDLKRILSNVKNRGIWGEMQLGVLLRDLLAPEQFAENVAVKQGSAERVEFALKLPGSKDGTVWLPIDAKFPQEDFQRLLEAREQADTAAADIALKQLERRLKVKPGISRINICVRRRLLILRSCICRSRGCLRSGKFAGIAG